MEHPEWIHRAAAEIVHDIAPIDSARASVSVYRETCAELIAKHVPKESVNQQVMEAVKALRAKAQIFGLRGATNHPSVKCEVRETTLGDWHLLDSAIAAAESAPSMHGATYRELDGANAKLCAEISTLQTQRDEAIEALREVVRVWSDNHGDDPIEVEQARAVLAKHQRDQPSAAAS